VVVTQNFQQPHLIFKATVKFNSTRERLEAATAKLNGQIFLGRPTVVTAATKVKVTVVSDEATEGSEIKYEEQGQSPESSIRRVPGIHLELTLRSSLLQGIGCWALSWPTLLLMVYLIY